MSNARYYKDAWAVILVLITIIFWFVAMVWASRSSAEEPEPPKVEFIASPWEGVFHAAEFEGARPFVEVGSYVTPGTVVGFINVDIMQPQRRMEVYAGVEGTVTQVLVVDGEFVSAGQSLMVVRLDTGDVLARP